MLPSQQQDATGAPHLGLWGTLSVLLVFGLTLPLWRTLDYVRTVYHESGVWQLPWLAEAAIQIGSLVWILAVPVGILGIDLFRKGERRGATRVFFWMTVVIVAFQILLLFALYYPFVTEEGV
jgi:cytochrome bd-type quinol oxidase subunit 2